MTPRQRIRTRSSTFAGLVGLALVVILGAAFVWYGLMVILLAFKVSPSTVNMISGYRTAYEFLAGLDAEDVDGATRAIIAGAGLLAFLFFGYLALRVVPRPYLARGELDLHQDRHGEVVVAPRAIERVAEIAANTTEDVDSARARYAEDELAIDVTALRARRLATALDEVRRRVDDALAQHELPSTRVAVALTGFERKHRRELR
jgi:hypothetical protein